MVFWQDQGNKHISCSSPQHKPRNKHNLPFEAPPPCPIMLYLDILPPAFTGSQIRATRSFHLSPVLPTQWETNFYQKHFQRGPEERTAESAKPKQLARDHEVAVDDPQGLAVSRAGPPSFEEKNLTFYMLVQKTGFYIPPSPFWHQLVKPFENKLFLENDF